MATRGAHWRSTGHVLVRQLVVWLVAGVALLLGAGTAFAHNVLVGSDPENNASVAVGPERITLRFDLPVRKSFSTVTVVGPNGNHFESGPPAVDGSTVTAPVGPLGQAGSYRVGYRIVSDDGHPVTGSIAFTLTQPGSGQGVPADQAPGAQAGAQSSSGESSSDGTGGGIPAWPWILGGILLVAGGATVALRLGR